MFPLMICDVNCPSMPTTLILTGHLSQHVVNFSLVKFKTDLDYWRQDGRHEFMLGSWPSALVDVPRRICGIYRICDYQ